MPITILHHTETVDPTLAAWILDLIDRVFGLGAWALIIVLGAVIVAIPTWLIVSNLRQRSYNRNHSSPPT